MSFCYFDAEAEKENYVMLDSLFVQHYLPYAEDSALKVYIYGLDVCNKSAENISIARFAEDLNMTETDVKEAFAYWECQGLVRVRENPFSVHYLSVRTRYGLSRTFKKQKYADFNKEVEELFDGRVITPQEFTEYYTIIEDGKLEPEAMVLIIKYCLAYCSKENPVRYIRKVANTWIDAGIRTVSDVEKRLMEEENASSDIRLVLGALGRTGAPEPHDRQLYVKWTTKLGFSHDAILAAAKNCKKKGGMQRLDEVLESYLAQHIYTALDIIEAAKRRDDTLDLAVRVNNKLGLYYANLDNVVETYISKWLTNGFTAESVLLVADMCFADDVRNLKGMDRVMDDLFKSGYVSADAVRKYIADIKTVDSAMEEIIKISGSNRKVRENDRAIYQNWLSWGFDFATIKEAAGLAVGKPYAIAYINQVLSNWKQTGRSARAMAEVSATNIVNTYDMSGLSEEERACKLRKDKEYATLEKERRKLSIEIAHIISGGGVPDAEKSARYEELEKLLTARREALGL